MSPNNGFHMSTSLFDASLREHRDLFSSLESLAPRIEAASQEMQAVLQQGGKILVAGNGGSAADAQHFAAELVGRFQSERQALPCLALTTDSSNLTAIGNDYGFQEVFSRQLQGLGMAGDLFVGISTSGNSPNIIQATKAARARGMRSLALLGCDGGQMAGLADLAVTVPHTVTARIQEAHIFILHHWADCLERSCLV
jgi:D-sedoheptulose 7-phosphate isomerase